MTTREAAYFIAFNVWMAAGFVAPTPALTFGAFAIAALALVVEQRERRRRRARAAEVSDLAMRDLGRVSGGLRAAPHPSQQG